MFSKRVNGKSQILSLSKYEPGNPNEHFTLKIQSPWSAQAFCKYQFPEWAFIAMSEFCLLGYIGKAASLDLRRLRIAAIINTAIFQS